MSDPATIRFYDEAASGFDALEARGVPEPSLARFIADLPPGAAVLDLGCGAGLATAQLAGAGFATTGLDASAALLDVARRLAPGARFIHAGFEALDARAAYDGIWANFSLLHAPRADLPRHLGAVFQALRPGGTFFLSMLLGAGERREARGLAYSYYAPEELRQLTSAQGFVEHHAETGTKPGAAEPFLALSLTRPA